MMILGDDVIDSDRVEGRLISNRERGLQSKQRTECDQLAGRIGGC